MEKKTKLIIGGVIIGAIVLITIIIIIVILVLTIGSKKTKILTYGSIIKFQSNLIPNVQRGDLFLSTCGRTTKTSNDSLICSLDPCCDRLNVTLRTNPSSEPTSIQWKIIKTEDKDSTKEVLYGDKIWLVNQKTPVGYLYPGCKDGVGTNCGDTNVIASNNTFAAGIGIWTLEGGDIGSPVSTNEFVKIKQFGSDSNYIATCGSTTSCGLNVTIPPNTISNYNERIKWIIQKA
jgi:hypothetical protein